MPRTSPDVVELPAGMPPTRRHPLLPTPTLPKTPQRKQPANSKELSVRILCLDSGQGVPSALQLRRLLGFSVVVDHVAPADRCEVAVYENPVSEVHVNLQPERMPKDAFMQIVVKWCDWELVQHVLGSGVDRSCRPPEWWLASEELEERCSPYDALVVMEHKDVTVKSFALGCLLGYNTFVAHFDSARTVLPGAKTSSSKKSALGPPVLTKSSKGKKPQPFPSQPKQNPPRGCRPPSPQFADIKRNNPWRQLHPTLGQPKRTILRCILNPRLFFGKFHHRKLPRLHRSLAMGRDNGGHPLGRAGGLQWWFPVREPPPEPFRPGPQPAVIQLPMPKKEPKGQRTALLTPSETAEDSGGQHFECSVRPSRAFSWLPAVAF
ncbi:hypothetical protein MRX96_013790 [Rhipicephalus microplus]